MRRTQELSSRIQPSISYKSVAHFYTGEGDPTLLCSNCLISFGVHMLFTHGVAIFTSVMSFPLLFLMHFVVFMHVTGCALVTCHSIDAFVSCCVNVFLMHTL